jgi:hypothetical protein
LEFYDLLFLSADYVAAYSHVILLVPVTDVEIKRLRKIMEKKVIFYESLRSTIG